MPTQAPSAAPEDPSSAPPRFMAEAPEVNISTPEQAIEVIQRADNYNPDLTYVASPNEYGTFDVSVRSLSLQAQGGSGAVEVYEVRPDGNFFPKSVIQR